MASPTSPSRSSQGRDDGHASQDRKHRHSDEDQEQEEDGYQSPNGSSPNRPMNKKPNSASPPSLRKEQNRAAQRAFRDRKERHLQQLENMIRDLKQQEENLTAQFQREIQQLKGRLEASNDENCYLREVVFAFETTLSEGGYASVLQDVKQKLVLRNNEKQAQREEATPNLLLSVPTLTATTTTTTTSLHSAIPSGSPQQPPHPLTMSLSRADPSYEMGVYTVNREILYKTPPFFVSLTPEDGQVVAVKSPLEPLSVPRPSYNEPGVYLPKHTDYTKHPTVFDELQSSLFPPGTLESLVHAGMATPQEVVNDKTPFDHTGEHDETHGEGITRADLLRFNISDQHRLYKELCVLTKSSPAVDPHISPQIYQLPHDPRIDLVPCPKLRAQMILHQNRYNLDELFQLLIDKSICHGHPLDVSNWQLPDEFFDRYGFLIGLDMERLRRKVWPKPRQDQEV